MTQLDVTVPSPMTTSNTLRKIRPTADPLDPHEHHRELYDQLVFSAFVISIFLGVVRVGSITLPVWFAAVPLMLYRFPPTSFRLRSFPPGLYLVLITAISVLVQIVAGHPPKREDFGVYLPITCTIVTLAAFSGLRLSAESVYRSLLAGGLFICSMIVAAFVVRCDGLSAPLTFYPLKQWVTTPLGDSNYLAVFLVLIFNVALYRRSVVAIVFAVFTLATMSRTGALFLVGSLGVWALVEFRLQRLAVAVGVVALFGFSGLMAGGHVKAFAEQMNRASMALFTPFLSLTNEACVAAPSLTGGGAGHVSTPPEPLTQGSSVDERFAIWGAAVNAVPNHLAFGTPRSYFRHVFLPGRWSAHNWLIDLMMLFGAIGLVCYLGYLWSGLSYVWNVSHHSNVWLGVMVGVGVTLAWGLIEAILLTQAYDTLLAVLFMVALNTLSADLRHSGGAPASRTPGDRRLRSILER